MDKLHDLYDSLAEARREIGEDAVPFHKFADLVKSQVKKLREQREPGGGVSRGGEGRQGELYGARAEGRTEGSEQREEPGAPRGTPGLRAGRVV